MKKILIIFIILLFTSGCNSYIELNNLAVINKIGIEHNDNYKLYASIIDSLDTNNLTPKEKIITVSGNTIYELIDNLSIKSNKKLYMSHLDLLIINNTIKNYEINELINYFLNNNETRENFLIIETNNIEEIITKSKFQEINNLIKINNKETSIGIYTTMYDLINNYLLNKPIYLSNINLKDNITLDGIVKIANNKITYIDNNNSIYINYLLNNINSYKTNIECNYNKYLYLNIIESNTNITSNNIYITNEIKILNNDCNLNKNKINILFNNNLINNLNKYTNKNIIIKNTIRSYK